MEELGAHAPPDLQIPGPAAGRCVRRIGLALRGWSPSCLRGQARAVIRPAAPAPTIRKCVRRRGVIDHHALTLAEFGIFPWTLVSHSDNMPKIRNASGTPHCISRAGRGMLRRVRERPA